MKKSLLAVAALSAVAGVAQADVSLYGILDVGIADLTHAGDFNGNFVTGAVPIGVPTYAKPGNAVGMMNGGESQTFWGIKGSENLGNGNKAFFVLEQAFSLGSGMIASSGLAGLGSNANNAQMAADTTLNGQMFNRKAYVGLSNTDLGAISFGRQYSLQLDIIGAGDYDAVNAQMFSPINFSGQYGGGGATDNSRVDNAVKYSKHFGNGMNVNALYGVGGMAGSVSARSNAQFNVGYENSVFGIQGAVQNAKDTTNLNPGATAGTVNVQFLDVTSYFVAMKYRPTTNSVVKLGYERMELDAPSDYAADLGLTSIYTYTIGTHSAWGAAQKNINVVWVGGSYNFTPAVKGSIGYYNVDTPAWGTAPDGTDQFYSAMLEYNLSKRTNLYAAWMLDHKSGANAPTAAQMAVGASDNYNTFGVGVRLKF
ncbi:MAG: porin [Betaproteobacteria bacterium]|nr:porin [Betaproteobacteria bacterium]MDE2622841.1 porin [Betaproteobacteria bacterium]